jgi:predicted RNase H-like nuclease
VARARDTPVNWSEKPPAGSTTVRELLDAAGRLAGDLMPDVVTVDMPIATVRFSGRRQADRLISQAFGAFGCSTHSPTAARPGSVGRTLSGGFESAGFNIATAQERVVPGLVEVYPHPALLSLMNATYRVPYKVAKRGRYWPTLTTAGRRRELVGKWTEIRRVLRRWIANIDLPLPTLSDAESLPFTHLKRYEDTLDALVCAWVGIQYLGGHCRSYGDHTAAIWTPDVRGKAMRPTDRFGARAA